MSHTLAGRVPSLLCLWFPVSGKVYFKRVVFELNPGATRWNGSSWEGIDLVKEWLQRQIQFCDVLFFPIARVVIFVQEIMGSSLTLKRPWIWPFDCQQFSPWSVKTHLLLKSNDVMFQILLWKGQEWTTNSPVQKCTDPYRPKWHHWMF